MSKRDIAKLMELTVSSAYESVLHEESWGVALEHLTTLTGANSSTYVMINNSVPEIVEAHDLDPVIMQSYNSEFASFDPFHGDIMHSAISRVVHDKREVDQAFIAQSIWFQEFYRRHQIQSMIALPLFENGNLAGSFNIQRSVGQGDFSDQEVLVLNQIMPHLVRASQISTKMNALRRSAEYSNTVLNTLTLPVLLLEEDGRVVLVNQAAEKLIQRESSLGLRQNRFSVINNGTLVNLKLSSRITNIIIQRGDGRKPLRMTTLPLAPRSILNASWQRPMYLIIFDDSELIPVSLNQLLPTLFNMTSSEVRVCIAIGCEGFSPQECSDLFGVTINTIRTQIRGVYTKMGVKRQAELVRMLTMLNMAQHQKD